MATCTTQIGVPCDFLRRVIITAMNLTVPSYLYFRSAKFTTFYCSVLFHTPMSIFAVPVIPNFLFQREHPKDYMCVRGQCTSESIQLCEEIERNTTDALDIITDNGTALNKCTYACTIRVYIFSSCSLPYNNNYNNYN